jgi:oligopeptide transport system ATP-binding protein
MTAENAPSPLIQVDDLAVTFELAARSWRWKPQLLRAVDGVTFDVRRGEALALVGESGSGKTTTGRALLGLHRPAHGSVRFDGAEVSRLKGAELKRFRGQAQMIFQDPYASLNPRMKVGAIIAEPLRAHRAGSQRQRRERVQELLRLVGLPPDASNRFPYAFSGGQRQRVGIARALALHPDFVVADEPVSALDVSVQAQVLNLLADLREELSLTMVFIAHNLAVVRHIASRVAVMYLGQLVEVGSRDEVFSRPAHPYTQALLRAVPPPDPGAGWSGGKVSLRGEIPSPVSPPSGCRFHTRCPHAADICRNVVPEIRTFASGRKVACHFAVDGSTGESSSPVSTAEVWPDGGPGGEVENRGILS